MYIQRIRTINGCTWRIYAVCSDRGDCPVAEFLTNQPSNFEANRDRLIALFDHVVKNGPRLLPEERCHQIANDIWEFIAGKLRIAWFYDEGKIIVCTHGFVKKTRKTKKSDTQKALDARKLYFLDKEQGKLIPIDNREKDNE
jgi:hypothetical protein